MRYVSRLARQTRAGLRRPAKPRWTVWLRRGGLAVLGLGLVGFAADTLWRSPAAARFALGREIARCRGLRRGGIRRRPRLQRGPQPRR